MIFGLPYKWCDNTNVKFQCGAAELARCDRTEATMWDAACRVGDEGFFLHDAYPNVPWCRVQGVGLGFGVLEMRV